MTAQEFFKNDLFAENPNILTQVPAHKEERSLRWQTLRLPQLPTRTAH